MAVAVMTIRFAVAWEMIGVISTRLKRTVTWIDDDARFALTLFSAI